MVKSYLDFEQPIADIESKILELENSDLDQNQINKEVIGLNESAVKLTEKIYSNLSPWQIVQVARHPERPHFVDYIKRITDEFDELHGDRHFSDDRAILGGVGRIGEYKAVIIGHEKGRSTEEKIKHNFGMSQPEGYRKACRLMKLAERFNLPVVTLIDTPGAYPGIDSEERGQSEAIAYNLKVMSSLKTPIIVNIVGEGGSGGALALGVGDHINMMEHATYSVASPEACASIVWRDSAMAAEAAEAMKLSAENILELQLIDEIIKEPLGGAHRNYDQASLKIKDSIIKNLDRITQIPLNQLVEQRYERLMSYGAL
ncbi:MAG TPA: acetyl-CoA carboxylase carboxyltransferase subunit alpha [SAR86 cluster bacterium]|nr:acetyl-CoA carboxylase carboxyltransferase subunit alpha [SAR86 cluster bacterium]HJM14758.1 acetyl-CoA carboxylase carboxyltransferase subunit alpha [SAR86 cluster bacterium]|tara:strand:- start:1617 stop:2564 length:948 start_codon:yes stop_codon:yes gene_type:complete